MWAPSNELFGVCGLVIVCAKVDGGSSGGWAGECERPLHGGLGGWIGLVSAREADDGGSVGG